MAGKPGMKGGGGKRPGAGRKKAVPVLLAIPVPAQVKPLAEKKTEPPKAALPVQARPEAETPQVERLDLAHKDPKIFLIALMNDLQADVKVRADAAKALMPFMHAKKETGGKKDEQQAAAKKVAAGKFGATAPPRLVSNRG